MLTLTAALGGAPVRIRPPPEAGTRSRPDGLDAARGVLFSALLGLGGWIAIAALIAVCTPG